MSQSYIEHFLSFFRPKPPRAEVQSRDIHFNLEKDDTGTARDDKLLDLLLADKNQRIVGVSWILCNRVIV